MIKTCPFCGKELFIIGSDGTLYCVNVNCPINLHRVTGQVLRPNL